MAAGDLVVPVLADFLSYDGLRLLFETIQGLEQDLSHQLENIFIVVNAFNQTFKIAREALEALRTHYAEYLLDSVVRQCTKFAQASSEGCPIFGYDPDSKGATDIEAMQREILGTDPQGGGARRRRGGSLGHAQGLRDQRPPAEAASPAAAPQPMARRADARRRRPPPRRHRSRWWPGR